DPQTGSAVKFEEGMGTTEADASAAPEGTGDEQEAELVPAVSALSPVPTEVSILEGLRVGKLTSGEIAPFSIVQLEVIFNPLKSGNAVAEFEISFSDPLSPPIMIRARGTGIDVPVWVQRETRPVPFKVRAVVTSSDIEFNMQDIDFGFCTVYESVRRTVTITNKSVLPQPFGFCGVPDVTDVWLSLLGVQSETGSITFHCFKQKKKGGKGVPAGKSAKTSPKRGSTPSVPNMATRSKTPVKTFTIDDVMDG
ncbi:unnamed protein product, partial [Porites evermanni]